jgi:light-regulated signal transduction histidine kinase (bacteriophytochrome)
LGKYAAHLDALNRNLEDFMFIAAHDLQEPLRKIQVFSDLFHSEYSDSLDEAGRDYLRRLGSSAKRVQELIRDIRAYSKLKSDTTSFNKVDLTVLAQKAASDLEEMIKATGAKIQIGDLPSVLADSHQMRLLFQNLLSNAMIYRKETKPIIMISSKKLEEDFQILVEDNGIGFDEKYSELIFKPFQRLHKRNENNGTGIGLAICRKIVEQHGGKITAKSTPGKGSTFIINFPVSQNDHGSRD